MPFTSVQLPPPTFTDPWVDQDGQPTTEIVNWFLITLLPSIALSPAVSNTGNPPIDYTNQSASISSTPLPVGNISSGVYRVSVFLRVTTADGVSSSVTPYVQYPNDGITCTDTGAALTSNNTAQPKGYTFIVESDAPGPISFGTTYVSNTPGQMKYKAVVIIERVQ